MKSSIFLSGFLVLGLGLPAVAQTESYYVVQDVKTKKCTITETKPSSSETITVGSDGTVYKTRVEAENAMKTVKVCTTTD